MGLADKLKRLKDFSDQFIEQRENIEIGEVNLEVGSLNTEEMGFLESWAIEKSKESGTFLSWLKIGIVVLGIKVIDKEVMPKGPIDLIDTGEKEDGVPIRRPRFEYLYDTIKTVDPLIIEQIANKFSTVSKKVQENITKSLITPELDEPPDGDKIQTEKRVLTRLKEEGTIRSDIEEHPVAQAIDAELPEKHTKSDISRIPNDRNKDSGHSGDTKNLK